MIEWQMTFELQEGRPSGRWQWVVESCDDDYYYPGRWLEYDAVAVPPLLEPSSVTSGAMHQ